MAKKSIHVNPYTRTRLGRLEHVSGYNKQVQVSEKYLTYLGSESAKQGQQTLFKDPKYEKYSEIVRMDSPWEAMKSIDQLLKEFAEGDTAKKLRVARVTQYAANRALATAKKENLSSSERTDLETIGKAYGRIAKDMWRQYKNSKQETRKPKTAIHSLWQNLSSDERGFLLYELGTKPSAIAKAKTTSYEELDASIKNTLEHMTRDVNKWVEKNEEIVERLRKKSYKSKTSRIFIEFDTNIKKGDKVKLKQNWFPFNKGDVLIAGENGVLERVRWHKLDDKKIQQDYMSPSILDPSFGIGGIKQRNFRIGSVERDILLLLKNREFMDEPELRKKIKTSNFRASIEKLQYRKKLIDSIPMDLQDPKSKDSYNLTEKGKWFVDNVKF